MHSRSLSRTTTHNETNLCGCVKAAESTTYQSHNIHYILYTAHLAELVRTYSFTWLSHHW